MDVQIQKRIEEEAERQYKNHEPYVKAVYCELAAKWGEFALSLTAPKWIEIKEGGQMPEEGHQVLVFCYDSQVTAQYRNGKFDNIWDGKEIHCVSHWQPLPPPPKE